MNLKILSWNIWVDGNIEEVKNFLKNSDADIIGLQEIGENPQRDVIGFLKSRGYNFVFAPKEKIWGSHIYKDGPAIFAKFPIVKSNLITSRKKTVESLLWQR